MKKFKLIGTNGRWITGNYLGVQVVNSPRLVYKEGTLASGIPLPKIENDLEMYLVYTDEYGCIWTEHIDAGDQIEFL
jgi:hypothetical protein